MRIGIDLGGTKIEGLAIDASGTELVRFRVDTPRFYQGTLDAIKGVVDRIEAETGQRGTVGAGIPGSISAKTGLVKNANSTWLNGQPLQRDLAALLGREVRIANDANCLVVSEATDGAAAGKAVVFGVIVGTGCGGGLAVHGQVHNGPNGVAGEWGHNPLPWPNAAESPGPECYCGKRGCLETWLSGTGVARDFMAVTGREITSREIVAGSEGGDEACEAALQRLEDRLARALAHLINMVDPEVIVFGGGLSRVQRLYQSVPKLLPEYVFGHEADTPLVPAKFGDSSGVRGAAWLWPQ
ncbi:MAG: fructokinase [Acidobacteriota bacterium]|nr:fructokinase [Acidobacteriota bacterium]